MYGFDFLQGLRQFMLKNGQQAIHGFQLLHKYNLVLQDPSEIILICWFAARESFLLTNDVENSAASYLSVNHNSFL